MNKKLMRCPGTGKCSNTCDEAHCGDHLFIEDACEYGCPDGYGPCQPVEEEPNEKGTEN
jgi:hypothetical protein